MRLHILGQGMKLDFMRQGVTHMQKSSRQLQCMHSTSHKAGASVAAFRWHECMRACMTGQLHLSRRTL